MRGISTLFCRLSHDALTSEKIKLLKNSSQCEIEHVPSELQLELVEIPSNENLKEYFKECYKNADLLVTITSFKPVLFPRFSN